jgi:hypothetical protein|tara:strand:+ start:498 stop:740 length:243 start_codon:yes stop_codon:yes gene_type:complete
MEINVEHNLIEMIGWVGFVLILFGYYYNAKQKIFCFHIWGTGNIFFLIYAIMINALPQVAMSIFVLGMNVYGWKQWSKDV